MNKHQRAIDSQKQQPAVQIEQVDTYWKWLTLFFAAAWLITLVKLLRKPEADKSADKIITRTSGAGVKSAVAEVVKHAYKNDANRTKAALIEWAQLFYNDKELTNLSQITEHCSVQLSQHIRQLNQSLYIQIPG